MTRGSVGTAVLAVLLAAGIGWLVRPEGWQRTGGLGLEPARLTLGVGETAPVDLVVRDRDVVAVSFRLRFDEDLVTIEYAEPTEASVFAGGNAINLALRRTAGTVHVPGLAMAGGRTFEPGGPLFRFRVTGRRPGPATVTVEDAHLVDGDDQVETLAVAPLVVVVHDAAPPVP